MLTGLLISLVKPLLGVLGILAAAAGIFFAGKNKAKNDAQIKEVKTEAAEKVVAAQKQVDTLKETQNVQADVANLPSGSAADKLQQSWTRD